MERMDGIRLDILNGREPNVEHHIPTGECFLIGWHQGVGFDNTRNGGECFLTVIRHSGSSGISGPLIDQLYENSANYHAKDDSVDACDG